MPVPASLARVAREPRACRLCATSLPLEPRPVFHVGCRARALLVGPAPGRRVPETGIPRPHPPGPHSHPCLRPEPPAVSQLARIAIVATGLCYPGTGASGDLPPRPQCAPTWQPRFRAALPALRLTLLVGSHAQAYYLGKRRKRPLAATVHAWREYLPEYFPLPHPSPRNRRWLRNNPWFERDVIPALRRCVDRALR